MNGVNHPVHIHGHNLQVIKIGFPRYNKSTNFFQHMSSDIQCEDPLNCNRLHWTNASWAGGNVEGILEDNPPLKDTILVPIGGYVVVRFKANNPGTRILLTLACHHMQLCLTLTVSKTYGRSTLWSIFVGIG